MGSLVRPGCVLVLVATYLCMRAHYTLETLECAKYNTPPPFIYDVQTST